MTGKGNADFIHRHLPVVNADLLTILALHGTGGNEDDLIPLARRVSPTAAILSPRGKVLENGMPRFFRRLAEGVFDIEDLMFRTDELAQFVKWASSVYHFDSSRVVALGYSNGANIAASLLLSHPDALAGAILLRPMVPFMPKELPSFKEKRVLILSGRADRIVPPDESEALQQLLTRSGADIELHWVQGGHALTEDDLTLSYRWFKEHFEESPKR